MFQTSTFNLGKKSILIWAINFIIKSMTKGIEVLAKRLFSFTIIVFSMKLLVILFVRKKSICQWIFLVHPIHVTRSTFYELFLNFVYLKDMYITLKVLEKFVCLSVRILLICKFLNFTAAFTKKNKLSKFCIQFSLLISV